MKQQLILELWHISRTALAGSAKGSARVPTRYDRMQYVYSEIRTRHADEFKHLSPKRLWLWIEEITSPVTPLY